MKAEITRAEKIRVLNDIQRIADALERIADKQGVPSGRTDGDTAARIDFLLETHALWSPEGEYVFPDGVKWKRYTPVEHG